MPRVNITFDASEAELTALRSVIAGPGTVELRNDIYFVSLPEGWSLNTESKMPLEDAILETLDDLVQRHWASGGYDDTKIAETLDGFRKVLRSKLGRLCR